MSERRDICEPPQASRMVGGEPRTERQATLGFVAFRK